MHPGFAHVRGPRLWEKNAVVGTATFDFAIRFRGVTLCWKGSKSAGPSARCWSPCLAADWSGFCWADLRRGQRETSRYCPVQRQRRCSSPREPKATTMGLRPGRRLPRQTCQSLPRSLGPPRTAPMATRLRPTQRRRHPGTPNWPPPSILWQATEPALRQMICSLGSSRRRRWMQAAAQEAAVVVVRQRRPAGHGPRARPLRPVARPPPASPQFPAVAGPAPRAVPRRPPR
jgi:hypothetical protein